MASVFFAIVLAIIMRSATTGVYENMIHNLVSFSSGYIQIHHKGYWENQSIDNTFVADEQLEIILQKQGVSDLVPRLETFALISFGNKTRGTAVVCVDPEMESEVTGLDRKIISGRLPQINEPAVVIGKRMAEILNAEPGDTIVLIGQGYHANSAAALLPVTGVVSLGSPQLDENLIYLPLDFGRKVFSADSLLTSLSIMIPSAYDLESFTQKLYATVDTGQYEVMTWKQMMPDLNQFIEADSAGHYITISILYLVISFGLLGTILMMTRERMHEFGILIAIGMKKRVLAASVMMEVFIISFLGALSGIAASIPVIAWFRFNPIRFTGQLEEAYKRYGFEPVMYFSNDQHIFTTQALIVFTITLVLTVYPFIKIQRIKPVEAINS
jgi:ABC-type lipoprotein release transport system permease subunit